MILVSLKSDFAFKAFFEDEQIRTRFISDVTGIPYKSIKSAKLIPTTLIKWWRKQKGGFLDVVILLNDDTKINIEMQIRKQKFWTKRQLYYLARTYSDDLGMGQNYDKLKKCIVISILDFNLTEDKEYHSKYTLRDQNNREHTDLFEVHVIELRKTLKEGNPINDWIRLFNAESEADLSHIITENEGVQRGMEVVKTLSLSKKLRIMYDQYMKEKRDRWAEDEYVKDLGRSEGLLEGEIKGEIKGEIIGRRDALIMILRSRWNVSDEAVNRVRDINDKEILDMLIAAAVNAKDWEEFDNLL